MTSPCFECLFLRKLGCKKVRYLVHRIPFTYLLIRRYNRFAVLACSHAGFHCCFPHLANCTSSATSRSNAPFPVQHAKSHRSYHNVTDLRAKVSFVSHDLGGPPAYATIARGRRSFLMRSIVFFFPSVTPRNLANWQQRQPRSCSVFYTLPKTCGIV